MREQLDGQFVEFRHAAVSAFTGVTGAKRLELLERSQVFRCLILLASRVEASALLDPRF